MEAGASAKDSFPDRGLRSAFATTDLAEGRKIALAVVESFPSCPIPEIARGFRNPTNYRLRMILAAGRLTHPNLR